MKKLLLTFGIGVLLLVGIAFALSDRILPFFFQPTTSQVPSGQISTSPQELNQTEGESEKNPVPKVLVENLDIPWEVVFLPDNSPLVTERSGQLVHILAEGRESIPVSGVRHVGEGGLLGMVLHPDFAANNEIYLYYTSQSDGKVTNRVERYLFSSDSHALSDRKVILEGIPGAANHDGGRLAFGSDGMLYITTGDAQNDSLAQDTRALAGKILRVTPEGEVPSDNPFGNPVFAYGLRNPQGLAWDAQGRLWATDHGPSGMQSGFDEVNLIKAGGNYGWPEIQGSQERTGMISPVIQSGSSETWAPAGLAIVDEQLLFVGLRGASVYAAEIVGDRLENLRSYYRNEFGRLRVFVVDPSGKSVLLGTSNRDGRGNPLAGDDRLIRVPLSDLTQVE